LPSHWLKSDELVDNVLRLGGSAEVRECDTQS
jgi:hypothetical protein